LEWYKPYVNLHLHSSTRKARILAICNLRKFVRHEMLVCALPSFHSEEQLIIMRIFESFDAPNGVRKSKACSVHLRSHNVEN
jgi:hypothetical protein